MCYNEYVVLKKHNERMLNIKMKNDSKSGLRISEIMATLCAFIIVSTSTQLILSKQNTAEKAEENLVTEEVQISKIEENETKALTTSRSGIRRGASEESQLVEEKTYKTIEEIEISKNMDLTVRCGISKEDFKELMKNLKPDTTDFFYNNSDIIYDLCEKYQLNEIFFCGLIAGESGWKISGGHRTKCNYISMMSKGKLIRYATPEEGLEAAAKLLHDKYLSEDGAYYSGKTLSAVQKRFCPNSSTWVNLVYGCMKQIVK